MSIPVLLLTIFGCSLWLSAMVLAAIIPLRPGALRLVAPLVCRKGERMEITTTKASYHRPGERGLVIECVSNSARRRVVFKTVFAAWAGLSVALTVIASVVVAVLVAQ